MKLESVGEIVAVRRLFLEGQEPSSGDILVKVGKPQQFPDSTDYYCPYQITGVGDEKVRYAGGIDAVQAIELAFRAIGIDLYVGINREFDDRLRWEGDEHGDLGFPRPPEA
jgi:hypothetical protein